MRAVGGERESINRAFTRTAGWTLACIAFAAVVAFAGVTARLLDHQVQRAITEEARLCAAALVPGPDGELLTSMDELRQRYDRLVAVALLDASDRLQTIYPDRAAHRAAVTATLEATPGPVPTGVFSDDTRRELWGIVVPLNGIDLHTSRKVVLVVAHDSCAEHCLIATAAFAAFMGSGCLLGFRRLTHWFERRVVHPLHGLADLADRRGEPCCRIMPIGTQGSCEMEQIGESLRALTRAVAESNHRRRRIERSAEWRLRDRERGFHRELRRAKDQASLDSLTRLRNRSFLEDELGHLVSRHRATGEDLAIVMLDVDNFKAHNDTHGHSAGDEVLSFIGDLLRTSIRSDDYAIRYGGDEFLLLLSGASTRQAAHVAERIVRLFAQYASMIRGGKRLSMSAGVASLHSMPGDDGFTLISEADRALYAAKRAGKNDVVACSPV